MKPHGTCDVAVIGAGPAGTSLAIALARAGYDTILFHRPDRKVAPADATYEILSGIAKTALQALGIWGAFLNMDPIPGMGTLARWGEEGSAELPAIFTPFGSGWHVARPAFDAFLRTQARQSGAAVRLFDGVVGATRTGPGNWQLRLRDAAEVSAAFVVDASGRSRVLARRLGARSERDDDLIALVSTVPTAGQDLSGKLLIEAMQCGWCYAIPADEGSCTIALMTDPSTLTALGAGNAERWRSALSRTSLLGQKTNLSATPTDPHRRLAGASRAVPSGGSGWLAVGDAALSFDPLAGRGLTQALWDGLRGAEAIAHWLNGAQEPLDRHRQMQTEAYDRHLWQKQSYYRMIESWKDVPFWQNRSGRNMAACSG